MAVYTTIDNPELYFQVKLYTSDGSDDTVITYDGSEDMAPNLVWIKDRSSATSSYVCDSVRGSTKRLRSDGTNAEATETTAVKSFGSDGFTLGTHGAVNSNTSQYATWNWKESATAGFDIVAHTGDTTADGHTVAHSLSAVPEMMISKNRSATSQWQVYTKAVGNGKALQLNGAGAPDTSSTYYNTTSPTSSVFTVGTDTGTNGNGNNMIVYLFRSVQGFSKISGTYIGNGNANGTFVYTGFKPAFVMTKASENTSGSNNWFMADNKRHSTGIGMNVIDRQLYANLSNADDTNSSIDFLSNGFKWRRDGGDTNYSGRTYIYMAFAEAPFVTGSSGVPATAR